MLNSSHLGKGDICPQIAHFQTTSAGFLGSTLNNSACPSTTYKAQIHLQPYLSRTIKEPFILRTIKESIHLEGACKSELRLCCAFWKQWPSHHYSLQLTWKFPSDESKPVTCILMKEKKMHLKVQHIKYTKGCWNAEKRKRARLLPQSHTANKTFTVTLEL